MLPTHTNRSEHGPPKRPSLERGTLAVGRVLEEAHLEQITSSLAVGIEAPCASGTSTVLFWQPGMTESTDDQMEVGERVIRSPMCGGVVGWRCGRTLDLRDP